MSGSGDYASGAHASAPNACHPQARVTVFGCGTVLGLKPQMGEMMLGEMRPGEMKLGETKLGATGGPCVLARATSAQGVAMADTTHTTPSRATTMSEGGNRDPAGDRRPIEDKGSAGYRTSWLGDGQSTGNKGSGSNGGSADHDGACTSWGTAQSSRVSQGGAAEEGAGLQPAGRTLMEQLLGRLGRN